MSNKLRDMFDDAKQEYTEKVSFENVAKYNKFLEAIKKATEEGVASEVDGVTGISVALKDGDSKYPLEKHDIVDKVMILPVETPVDITVDTDKGSRNLQFSRIACTEKFILRNVNGKGASYQMVYDLKTRSITVNYKAEYSQANTIEELIDYYNTLYYFSKQLFRADIKNEDVDTILNRFLSSVLYFERLNKLSEIFDLHLTPQSIEKIDDEDLFIERLYFSLVEKRAIRCNRKVTSMNSVHFESDRRPGDNPMIVTYLEESRAYIADEEVTVYIVNMAFNLLIEKEEQEDNGDSKLYFKDDENNPMYIVSRFFINKDEAIKELENGLEDKKDYEFAKTLFEYIRESHDAKALKK